MFEKKEFEKKFGQHTAVAVDVTPDLKLKVTFEISVDLVEEAKKLAAKTNTPIDDTAVAWLQKLAEANAEKSAA
jgi:hypothetical protein